MRCRLILGIMNVTCWKGLAVDTIAAISIAEKSGGKPHEMFFSQIDSVQIWPVTAAIFKEARHPNASKLLLNWYLSPESQSRLPAGNWPARSDVVPSGGMRPILSYALINNYRDFLTDDG